MTLIDLRHGDCLEVLAELEAESVDACVTDPPYGLGFMGKAWDRHAGAAGYQAWCEAWGREVLRVLKPGAHLLAFGGTRTYHRLACGLEDAGFEIRDQIGWAYGSGFPKSLDVSRAIDAHLGAERTERVGVKAGHQEFVGTGTGPGERLFEREWTKDPERVEASHWRTAPVTAEAKRWEGWGTALKPAWEPIVVARKPLAGSVAENVLRYGVGGLNVDECRVDTDASRPLRLNRGETAPNCYGAGLAGSYAAGDTSEGRWPANLIHDGSGEVLALFPDEAGAAAPVRGTEPSAPGAHVYGERERVAENPFYGDLGSAARFFYCAKASPADRDEGLARASATARDPEWRSIDRRPGDPYVERPRGNHHPTVKPTELMRYLVRLVTPVGALVLDPFMGSGSTGKAAKYEDRRFLGIERDAEYVELARARIGYVQTQQAMAL